MCGEYIRQWSVDECLTRCRQWLLSELPEDAWGEHSGWLRNVVACYQERVEVLSEFPDKIQWLLKDPELDEGALKAIKKRPACHQWFAGFAELLETLPKASSFPEDRGDADDAVRLPTREDQPEPECSFATPAGLERAARQWADEREIKFGHFVGPVRAALTGTNKGPGFFDVVFLLGKEACIRRLRKHAEE